MTTSYIVVLVILCLFTLLLVTCAMYYVVYEWKQLKFVKPRNGPTVAPRLPTSAALDETPESLVREANWQDAGLTYIYQMDKSETVLISIVVTVCVIAVGGISAVILLLVCKFTNFWKRRHDGRINVAPMRRNQSRNQSRNNRRQSRHGQSANTNNPASGNVREPPPYSETEYNPPPIYNPVDMIRDSIDPTSQGTGYPDNETIAYSPPPPYTILPPRTLITRESSTRGTVNFSRNSFCRPGTGTTNTQLVTPAGIVLSSVLHVGGNSRHTSASGSSRHTSGASRSRQRPPLSNDRTSSSIQHS